MWSSARTAIKILDLDKFSFLYRHAQVRILVLCAIIAIVISWVRTAAAGSIMVDYHRIEGVPLWTAYLGLLTCCGLGSYSLYRLWRQNEITTTQVRITAYVLIAIYSAMLPMISNDLFSLLAYGDAANRGVDVYTDVASLRISTFFVYVSPLWRLAPCVYGPVCLTTSRLAGMVAGGNIYIAILAYKVLAFAWAVVFVECMVRIAGILKLSGRILALVLLNPLFLIQGIGQLHCDAIAIALVAAMTFFALSRRWYVAFVFAGLAIVAKMSYVLMLPFLVGVLYIYKDSWRQLIIQVLAGTGIVAATVALVYLPYFSSIKTVAVPFDFLTSQKPAKSAAEVIGDVIYFAPGVILGENAELHDSIKRTSGLLDGQLRIWLAVQQVLKVFALLMSLVLLTRFWMGSRSLAAWCRTYVRLLLLFLLFFSHVFYPWYLLFIIPLLIYEADSRFIGWLLAMLALAIMQDAMTFASHESVLYYCILIMTFASVLSFFLMFRTVYFRSHLPAE